MKLMHIYSKHRAFVHVMTLGMRGVARIFSQGAGISRKPGGRPSSLLDSVLDFKGFFVGGSNPAKGWVGPLSMPCGWQLAGGALW